MYEAMLGRATALKTTRTGHCDGTWGEGQLWIDRSARGSDDKRRTPSIVNGYNLPIDRTIAQRWFRAAAELGHGYAQLMLGRYMMLLSG